MLDNYTTKQLLELHSLCTDLVEEIDHIEPRADALLVLQFINEALANRRSEKLIAFPKRQARSVKRESQPLECSSKAHP